MGCSSSKDAAVVPPPAEAPVLKKAGATTAGSTPPEGSIGGSMRYNMLTTITDPLEAKYEIHNTLGDGAYGCVVRRVIRKKDGEKFACKTFSVSPEQTKKEQGYMLKMLKNEVELMRSLDHPNILRIYEVVETPVSIHIVMELCTGGDLGKRIYTEVEACRVVRKILRAISFIHDRGICHRDLKVENILWDSRGPDAEVKLIDFGMSQRFRKDQHMTERVGTVYCMAPEVLYGEYTEKCDMWSIGCITFHILTGIPPFEQPTEEETMKQLVAVKYTWPAHSQLPTSTEAKHFVYNLLKYDPTKRWNALQALDSAWMKKHKLQNDSVDSRLQRPSLPHHALESLRRFKGYGPLKKTALMVVAFDSNPQVVADLRRLFVKYDAEKNGVLSAEEVRMALQEFGLTDEEAKEIHAGADVDKSGNIHYLEFLAATIEAYGEVSDRQVEETFRRLDLDASGGISKQNFRDMLGEQYTPELIDLMVKEAELNEKGEIDLKSFSQLMRSKQGNTNALLKAEQGQVDMLRVSMEIEASPRDGAMPVPLRRSLSGNSGGRRSASPDGDSAWFKLPDVAEGKIGEEVGSATGSPQPKNPDPDKASAAEDPLPVREDSKVEAAA